MASISIKNISHRESAATLIFNASTPEKVLTVIDKMFTERTPFKRYGYPRAGAFDRLIVLSIWQRENTKLSGRFWIPSPRYLLSKDIICSGSLQSLIHGEDSADANILTLTAYRTKPGEIKYGEINTLFARAEMGIFLESLHIELCNLGIPNRIQGGINLQNIGQTLRLPLDVNEMLGILA